MRSASPESDGEPANTPAMNSRRARPRIRTRKDDRPFFLFSLVQTLANFLFAYVIAVVVFLGLHDLLGRPKGPLWDEALKAPISFIVTMVVGAVISIPYFQKEWDRSMRSLSLFTALLLLVFAVGGAGISFLDPNLPLVWLQKNALAPLRTALGF